MITRRAKMRIRNRVRPPSQPEAGAGWWGSEGPGVGIGVPAPPPWLDRAGQARPPPPEPPGSRLGLAATLAPVSESARQPGTGRASPPRCSSLLPASGPHRGSHRGSQGTNLGFRALGQTFTAGPVRNSRRTSCLAQTGHGWAVELSSSGSRGSCGDAPSPRAEELSPNCSPCPGRMNE